MNLHRWCLANEQIGWPAMMFYSYATLGKWSNLMSDIFSNGLKPRMLGQTCFWLFWLENSEPDLFDLWSSWVQHGKLFRNSAQLIVQHPGIKISMNHRSVELPRLGGHPYLGRFPFWLDYATWPPPTKEPISTTCPAPENPGFSLDRGLR